MKREEDARRMAKGGWWLPRDGATGDGGRLVLRRVVGVGRGGAA
jgi:hypothetical protein